MPRTMPALIPALRLSAMTTAIIMAFSSVGLAVPIASQAATADGLPDAVEPTWKQSIEQQQVWQDTLQKQRIESLRQSNSQLDDTQNNTSPSTDSDVDTALETPTSSCLSVQRIELGSLPELGRADQQKLRQHAEQISNAAYSQPMSTEQMSVTGSSPQCISMTDANALVRDITQAYLDAGFFKISINPTTDQQGTSTWNIYIAKITDIDNQTSLPTPRLLGNIIGQPANMAVLDQAVSNGERIIDGQLLVDIYPVGEKGKDVRLKVSQQGQVDSVSTDMEWRYDPDDSYGHHQIKLHSTLRNIFGQADLTSVSIQQSLTDKYGYDKDNQRRSASLYTSIPNGRWQWSGLLAADEYKRTTRLPNSVLEQTGDSWQANIRGDYTFNRDQDSISTLYGQAAHQEVTSEVLGSKIDVQSPTLSSGRVGISHTKLFNRRSESDPNKVTTGAWVLDLSAEKGFGNHDNPATKQGLKDDYLRWLLSGYLTHQHTLLASGKNVGYWQMTHELQGQYSDDQLFGVNQQSLGSTYSGVRGIDNVYSAAESGITLRNTLSYEPMQTSWKSFGNQKIRWSPYIGLDYGVVKYTDNTLSDDTSDAMSGTVGIKLMGYDARGSSLNRSWQLDVSASRAHIDYANQQIDGTQDTEVSAAWQWYF